MIVRLTLSAICLLVVVAVAITTAPDSSAAARNVGLSAIQQTCPTISVACPADPENGEPITFTASVNGGNPNVVPVYYWEVSVGKIIDGQGSDSISVDMTGFDGHSFTGTVRVVGFDLACPMTASCSLIRENGDLNPKKFDSYGALPRQKELTRLDAFARQLQNEPGAQGYLLVYGRRRGRTDEAKTVAARSQEYLIKTRAIQADRIVTVDGGFKETLTTDLWIVPTGFNRPKAEPTVGPSEVIIRKPDKNRSKH